MKYWMTATFLLVATGAQAQTHPCDVTPAPNPTVSSPYTVAFCWDQKDTDGLPMSPSWVQVQIRIDGVSGPLQALPTPTGAPSATGENYYQITGNTSARGAHSVVVALVAPEGEGVSAPFAYTVKGKPPKPPRARVVP